jgi:hypothetical protein
MSAPRISRKLPSFKLSCLIAEEAFQSFTETVDGMVAEARADGR